MRDVEGKVAFITGGGSGVGFGMAKVFLEAGMKVVIADIRQDHLDEAMAELKKTGGEVHALQLDVADREAFAAAAEEAVGIFGKVHVLCNNAGINLFKPMDECTFQDWDWILGVNLGGVVNGVVTFIPHLTAHGEGGHIVNTASMASIIAAPAAGIYTTSKFAVRGMTETLRYFMAKHGIGVSVLCPGLVRSSIHESDLIRPETLGGGKPPPKEFVERMEKVHAAGMDPVEVGEKVLRGIRRNDLYIFPHPEFKEELRGIFDEILEALPEGKAPPERLAIEEARRRQAAEEKQKIEAAAAEDRKHMP